MKIIFKFIIVSSLLFPIQIESQNLGQRYGWFDTDDSNSNFFFLRGAMIAYKIMKLKPNWAMPDLSISDNARTAEEKVMQASFEVDKLIRQSRTNNTSISFKEAIDQICK